MATSRRVQPDLNLDAGLVLGALRPTQGAAEDRGCFQHTFQAVPPRPGCIRDVEDERQLAEHAEALAVEGDLGHRLNAAQIQNEALALSQTVGGQVEGALIVSRAGELSDGFVGVLR